MKSFNVILYEDMVSSSDFQEEKRYALSVEVMTGSYLTARRLVSCPCPNIALSSVCIGTEKPGPGGNKFDSGRPGAD